MEWPNGKGPDALVGNIGGLKKNRDIALEESEERRRRHIEAIRRGRQWPDINRVKSVVVYVLL